MTESSDESDYIAEFDLDIVPSPSEGSGGPKPEDGPEAKGTEDPAKDAEEEDEACPGCPPAESSKLELEARSLGHLLTHKPFNSKCDACQSAKMKDVPHFKGAFDGAPAKWGDLLTCDHLDSRSDGVAGITGDRQALVVKDVWSKFKMIYPALTKRPQTSRHRLEIS